MPRPTTIYHLSDIALSELPKLIKLDVKAGIKDFCIALILAARNANRSQLNRAQLTEALKTYSPIQSEGKKTKTLSTANSMISRRIKELESLGCLKIKSEYRRVGGKNRKVTVNEFLSFEGLLQHLNSQPNQSPAPQGRPKNNDLIVYSDLLEGEGLVKLDTDNKVIPYAEGAFSILESAARSKYDTDDVIHCRYFIKKNDYVEITAATSTKKGSDIMFSSDQRVIQAFNGMLKNAHAESQGDLFDDDLPAKLVGQYCFFSLHTLTREIGIASNVKENRKNVIRMIERLKDTTYSVDASHSEYWCQRYMPHEKFSKAEYRYITEFYSSSQYISEHGSDGLDHRYLEERFFVVKFHELVYRAMTTPKLAFISHDDLKRERLDIVHRLNNWVKPVIGVRARQIPKDHHQYTLDIFHQRVRPASRLDNFERQFLSMAKRQNKIEVGSLHEETEEIIFGEKLEIIRSGIFWLNGYYYKIEQNEELAKNIYRKTRTIKKRRKKIYPVITIWRDVKDEIVGDESDHNKALRRQFNALNELQSNHDTLGSELEYSGNIVEDSLYNDPPSIEVDGFYETNIIDESEPVAR